MGLISRLFGSKDENPWPGYPERDMRGRDTEARIQALVDGCVAGREEPGGADGWAVSAEVIEVHTNRDPGKSPAQLAFPDPVQHASRPRSSQGQIPRGSRITPATASTNTGRRRGCS